MKEKKKLKVKFGDYFRDFTPEKNMIYRILLEKYDVEVCEEGEEYYIGSCFGTEYLRSNGVRIFCSGEVLTPDFNAYDYALGFDHLSFGDRYLRIPNYLQYARYYDSLRLMQEKHIFKREDILKKKNEFCAYVVSKGEGYVDSARIEIFDALTKYKRVNSGGKYMNNLAGTRFESESKGIKDKIDFLEYHRFSVAFENVSYPGYCTEKLIEAFAAQTIPIYWGDPEVGKTFNKKAFIDCNDYSSWDDVVKRVEEIDNNPDLYFEMLAEPALLDPDTINNDLEAFRSFIFHIFDQPLDKAYRRDRIGWMKKHCDQIKNMAEMSNEYKRKLKQKNYIGRLINKLKRNQ